MKIREYHDYIGGDVYKCPLGDCTINGASERFKTLYVVKEYVTLEDVLEHVKDSNKSAEQFFKVDYEFYKWRGYVRLQPLVKVDGKWNCDGGNYLCSCDSRFKEYVCGCEYPVPIHDRWESYEY